MYHLIRDFRPQGHAYYKDDRNRIYVADCSGITPDATDDGPLAVNFQRKPRIERVSVPLADGCSTVAAGEEAEFVLRLFLDRD